MCGGAVFSCGGLIGLGGETFCAVCGVADFDGNSKRSLCIYIYIYIYICMYKYIYIYMNCPEV